jgi:hypothetical protein
MILQIFVQRKNNHSLSGLRADIGVKTNHFEASDLLNRFFNQRFALL